MPFLKLDIRPHINFIHKPGLIDIQKKTNPLLRKAIFVLNLIRSLLKQYVKKIYVMSLNGLTF